MILSKCKVASEGLNYIVYTTDFEGDNIFIMHLGGPNKRVLYRMGKELLNTEFYNKEIFFCMEHLEYWRRHSEYVGNFEDGTPIYRLTRFDRR